SPRPRRGDSSAGPSRRCRRRPRQPEPRRARAVRPGATLSSGPFDRDKPQPAYETSRRAASTIAEHRCTMNLFDLTGRAALITGASRGIGLAIAEALGCAGAQVVLNARSRQSLDQAALHLRSCGIRADISVFDVTDPPRVAAGVEA